MADNKVILSPGGVGQEFLFKLEFLAGVTQLVESQPSKLLVAGSSPVSRSKDLEPTADVAQLVEHFLGKEEVTGSIPVISSNIVKRSSRNGGIISLKKIFKGK